MSIQYTRVAWTRVDYFWLGLVSARDYYIWILYGLLYKFHNVKTFQIVCLSACLFVKKYPFFLQKTHCIFQKYKTKHLSVVSFVQGSCLHAQTLVCLSVCLFVKNTSFFTFFRQKIEFQKITTCLSVQYDPVQGSCLHTQALVCLSACLSVSKKYLIFHIFPSTN